jgi:hypothetical protein
MPKLASEFAYMKRVWILCAVYSVIPTLAGEERYEFKVMIDKGSDLRHIMSVHKYLPPEDPPPLSCLPPLF